MDVRASIRCRICGARVHLDGPSGIFPHLVVEHPESDAARAIFLALAAGVPTGGPDPSPPAPTHHRTPVRPVDRAESVSNGF